MKVIYNKRAETACTLFDTGAQATFISKELVNTLKLPIIGTTRLTVTGFWTTAETTEFELVKFNVKFGRYLCRITAVVRPDMNNMICMEGLSEATELMKELGVRLASPNVTSDTVGPVQLIIGSDYCPKFLLGSWRRHGISLYRSPAGNLITGVLSSTRPNVKHHDRTLYVDQTMSLMVARIGLQQIPGQVPELIEEGTEHVSKLWELDAIGIRCEEPSPEDRLTTKLYEDSVQFEKGQYWVRLPWKPDAPQLPSNYTGARAQLYSQLRKLRDRPEHLDAYERIIQEQLQCGFIEKASNPMVNDGHYLPHHAVKKESATTPIRIVFNCSCRAQRGKPSLNDCLFTGPNMTENLGDALLKFRVGMLAFVADISKAFLRIGLQEPDRKYTKFLWPQDPRNPNSPLLTYQFKSVLFGSCASPFLLCSTLKKHFSSESGTRIGHMFYMDNFQGAVNTEEELLDVYKTANSECKRAGLPLQTWNTNSKTLTNQILQDFEGTPPTSQGVLGLLWNVENDRLALKLVKFPEVVLTKRTLLSQVSKIFDPLGLLSPILIAGKILIQQAWKEKLDWDTPLSQEYKDRWDAIQKEYSSIFTVTFPRDLRYQENNTSLHVFADASSKAYGAAAYLVTEMVSRLIMAKARVAPLKGLTLPKLELTALELATRLAVYLTTTIGKFREVYIWTDSEICLYWLGKRECTMPYVRNRVQRITDLADLNYVYKHTPTTQNPADLLSRGISAKRLNKTTLWTEGPDWLTQPVSEWPAQKDFEGPKEFVLCSSQAIKLDLVTVPVLDIERISNLRKLVRITELVFTFLTRKCGLKKINPVSYWVRVAQGKHFVEVITALNANKRHKLVKDLGLYLDDLGIIRCRGRLSKSRLSVHAMNPILLPKGDRLTTLMILDAHETELHAGMTHTLTRLRQQYWIPQGRQAVKKTLKSCIRCRQYEAPSYRYPGAPALPAERVSSHRPFSTTGVDYTGAITLTGGESPIKVYVCLFTCTYTRAVHLELAEDLTAETFLHLFRRFAARRSCPLKLISDNATNFVDAQPLLSRIMENARVQSALKLRGCTWQFVAPRAPWQNGFTERMIGIIKNCLRKTLHRKKLDKAELITVLAEVETRVNNRPLTYVSDEPNITPLTPSHLLHGRTLLPLPSPDLAPEIEDPDLDTTQLEGELKRRFHHLNKILEDWDRCWGEDYLLSLRERHYANVAPSNHLEIKEGDVVILKGDRPRSQWPLAKIVKLHPDGDCVIRMVTVWSGGKESLRTIEKLVPLELSSPKEDVGAGSSVKKDDEERPKRRAAEVARSRWRNVELEGELT